MSRLISRLLLVSTMVLAVPVVYTALFITIERSLFRRDAHALHVTNVVIGVLFMIGWIALWSPQLNWTPRRRHLTALSVLWSVGPGVFVGLLMAVFSREDEVGIVFGGIGWILTWMASTALVWRETAAERIHRLRSMATGAVGCPACGYNMTGLREARCPECGAQYTLDELLAALTENANELDSAPPR